jgi:peptidoglycan-associated lipoprotein
LQRAASAPQSAQPTPKGVPVQRSVYYDFDRYDVKPEFRPAIEAHARGSREYNLALGQIETVSFGEEKPRSAGHDEASWAENRRSDFVYQRGE